MLSSVKLHNVLLTVGQGRMSLFHSWVLDESASSFIWPGGAESLVASCAGLSLPQPFAWGSCPITEAEAL